MAHISGSTDAVHADRHSPLRTDTGVANDDWFIGVVRVSDRIFADNLDGTSPND